MNTEIITFQPRYAENFRALNLDWLQKFFFVEARDEEILGNPEANIIQPGGHIFFIKNKDRILGTIALIKISEEVFELSKMAVKPGFQGEGLGKKLLKFAIDFAKEQGWKSLLLYTNRKLENAVHLYKKYGFREVEMEKDNPYERGDIKMILEL